MLLCITLQERKVKYKKIKCLAQNHNLGSSELRIGTKNPMLQHMDRSHQMDEERKPEPEQVLPGQAFLPSPSEGELSGSTAPQPQCLLNIYI